MNYHVFLDTNAVDHSQTQPLVIALHNSNKNFFKNAKLYVTLQVMHEMKQVTHVDIDKGLGELSKIERVYGDIKYKINLVKELYSYLFDMAELAKRNYPQGLPADHILAFLGVAHVIISYLPYIYGSPLQDAFDFVENDVLQILSEIGIVYDPTQLKDSVDLLLGRIIEYTPVGQKDCYGFTYKDITRIIGNYGEDYKKLSGKKNKTRYEKDLRVLFDMLLYVVTHSPDYVQSKYIFLTGDYDLSKEIINLKNDVKGGLLTSNDFYKDLSASFKDAFADFVNNVIIIEVDISKGVYRSRDANIESARIEDVL